MILRAFTKLYAMAGVRLGYCVCSDAKRKEQLMESGQPWGVSLLAQEAGVAALSEQAYADRVRKLVEQQRPILVKGLRQAGFTVWEGKANYLLFRSHDATLGKRMEEAGFPMRDCSNYHNLQPGDYRIAVRTEEENRGFLEALFCVREKAALNQIASELSEDVCGNGMGKNNEAKYYDSGHDVECRKEPDLRGTVPYFYAGWF